MMLKTFEYAKLNSIELQELTTRNTDPSHAIQDTVLDIIQEVRQNGDKALISYAQQFDKVELEKLYLDANDIDALASTINREQQRALEIAFQNIHKFHSSQVKRERVVETTIGVKCWREIRPI